MNRNTLFLSAALCALGCFGFGCTPQETDDQMAVQKNLGKNDSSGTSFQCSTTKWSYLHFFQFSKNTFVLELVEEFPNKKTMTSTFQKTMVAKFTKNGDKFVSEDKATVVSATAINPPHYGYNHDIGGGDTKLTFQYGTDGEDDQIAYDFAELSKKIYNLFPIVADNDSGDHLGFYGIPKNGPYDIYCYDLTNSEEVKGI